MRACQSPQTRLRRPVRARCPNPSARAPPESLPGQPWRLGRTDYPHRKPGPVAAVPAGPASLGRTCRESSGKNQAGLADDSGRRRPRRGESAPGWWLPVIRIRRRPSSSPCTGPEADRCAVDRSACWSVHRRSPSGSWAGRPTLASKLSETEREPRASRSRPEALLQRCPPSTRAGA